MESFLSLFVFHDTYVVSFLVIGITIVVVMLLVFNQKSPGSVVKSEMGDTDNVEGALRRVLGEQRWALREGAQSEGGEDVSGRLGELESEVLEKDRAIADLNKQLTQSGTTAEGGVASGDNSDLMSRISELEARLEEYEIIEDDIADLSLYKTENDKLTSELAKLKAMVGGGVDVVAEESVAPEVEVIKEEIVEPSVNVLTEDNSSGTEAEAADLVAEFEKVVNSQTEITPEESSRVSIKKDTETGKVLMADQFVVKSDSPEVVTDVVVHPKLANVSPNSKEEADVFVTELKSLKKGS